ncbi:MAG: 1,2-phenylacetyl-CoA epoxidase subunit PaaD [Chitinophagaceae bacterium]|jgi:ring-1,2-phenylacetyl-CoA epoxidase subunit PaaD
MEIKKNITIKQVWEILYSISDPEIPVLSIIDLGIVKHVELLPNNEILINITPTYTACPAMDAIAMSIKLELLQVGFSKVTVNLILNPSWSTDDITENGKLKLKQYGIAPPKGKANILVENGVECPQCNSTNTIVISEFGSTACKALYKCNNCLEPFDYFKCY